MRGDDGPKGARSTRSIRFTPTCVGTTSESLEHLQRTAVHPHVRGDDRLQRNGLRRANGSPPRAWGRPHPFYRWRTPHRFTPTCVGTTAAAATRRCCGTVHPHVRGDDVLMHPHVRVRARFTPTCVGTTAVPVRTETRRVGSPPRAWGRRSRMRAYISSPLVHPRVRGDDDRDGTGRGRCYGSPPRAWGRRSRRRVASGLGRFTPTCVGTTYCEGACFQAPSRFTPTCVGTTTCGWACRSRRPVHPHVRGDDANDDYLFRQGDGSPPRAWGRPTPARSRPVAASVHPHVRGDDEHHQPISCRNERFTPTCVGTTLT